MSNDRCDSRKKISPGPLLGVALDNPPDFDYRFNLGYGREYTSAPELIATIRTILDEETERRARGETQ